jgi:exopolysaccharide biosynthesis polyprenyl glycosylphosphotransferase
MIQAVSSTSLQPADSPRRRFGRKVNFFFKITAFIADLLLGVAIYFLIDYLTGFYSHTTASAVIIPVVLAIIGMMLVGGYRYSTDFASLRYASEHLIAFVLIYPLAAFLLYVVISFGPDPTSGRGIFTISYFALAVCSLVTRRSYWFFLSKFRRARPFLVIVDEKFGPVFYRDYLLHSRSHPIVYAAANQSLVEKELDGPGSPVISLNAASVIDSLILDQAGAYEGVILAANPESLEEEQLYRLGTIHFEEMPVYSLETFYEKHWERIPLQTVGPAWPLEAEYILVDHSVFTSLKRWADILLSLFALIIVSPVMALVALAVRLFDGAPVFYAQERVGIYGKTFTIFKFRTMNVGSDKGDRYTAEGDNRITRIGNILRKTRLDELPQLWNVLRGDMSMIGPRAEWIKLVKDYDQRIAHYHFRHLVRPGITGWAQVNYPYGANLEDTLMKLSYDLYYIRNFSVRLDAEVILKTIYVMLFGKGR